MMEISSEDLLVWVLNLVAFIAAFMYIFLDAVAESALELASVNGPVDFGYYVLMAQSEVMFKIIGMIVIIVDLLYLFKKMKELNEYQRNTL